MRSVSSICQFDNFLTDTSRQFLTLHIVSVSVSRRRLHHASLLLALMMMLLLLFKLHVVMVDESVQLVEVLTTTESNLFGHDLLPQYDQLTLLAFASPVSTVGFVALETGEVSMIAASCTSRVPSTRVAAIQRCRLHRHFDAITVETAGQG